MDFEAAWCPVCSRQIEPKRIQVPVINPQPQTPAPPPSPQSSPSKRDNAAARRKFAARTRGGLVQGTGRMKPNGTIKRTDSSSNKPPQTSQRLPQKPAAPIKYRTVIDQAPLPLYCSEQCKRQDDEASSGSSAESSGSSIPVSESSISTVSSASCEQPEPEPAPHTEPCYASPSVAVIAKIYNFPPPPPPAPIAFEDARASDSYYLPTSCENGIIMAGRYIQERCAKPAKPQTGPHKPIPEPIKQVPGWNDGTNTWRSCVYSMNSAPAAPQVKHRRAFGSFVSPHSQLGDAPTPPRSASYSSVPSNATMISKYTDSLKNRATSPSSDTTLPKRERSLLPPGVEGKLLVPDVKLKVRTGSSASLGSRVRSPLSATSESGDEESTRCESPRSPIYSKRPVPETRSWSYDKFKTYDIMPFPTKLEKRTQVQVVDGKEVRVEVEVAVQAPLKRLFLFPASVRASP